MAGAATRCIEPGGCVHDEAEHLAVPDGEDDIFRLSGVLSLDIEEELLDRLVLMVKGPLAETLKGHDVILVVGTAVFPYYPYIPGPATPDGTRLIAITSDPEWNGGEYTKQPHGALMTIYALSTIAGSSPLADQKRLPTRDAADKATR